MHSSLGRIESGKASDWRIERAFDRTGAENMHRDEELARELVADIAALNILRLYSWQPAAISIGFQQKLEAIDLDACQMAGIDVVRRPTGGRAVLHINELTYAVIMREETGAGITASHNRIVEALLKSLASIESATSIHLSQTRGEGSLPIREAYAPGKLTNVACFMSTARHEATWQGKKVIGSAQRRFGGVLLQHGSILLSSEHLRLPDLLALDEPSRITMREALERETATLADVFGREISIEEAANAIASTFPMHICAEFFTAVNSH